MTAPRTSGRGSAEASSARTVLQITDCHLLAPAPAGAAVPTLLGVDTADTLSAVLEQALGEAVPDAIVASGDLAHEGEAAAYQRFQALLAERFQGPLMCLAGNHDLGEPLRAVLGGGGSLRLDTWEIIGFDSHADHQTEAALGEAERRELAARIEGSDAEHVLLVCHHHLLPVGCPWLDKDCIPRGQELLESLAGHARVRGLVFGHVHQEVRTRCGGMPVLGTPSTCFQFQPRSERFALDRSAGTGRPGWRWLTLQPDGSIDTRVHRLTGYDMNIDSPERS